MFLVSLIVYSFAVFAIRLRVGPTGDEPHYLVVTRSIVYDHDLNLRNNYLDKHWRAFFGGDLGWKGHAYEYGQSGVLTTIHPIGLPMFIALPYSVAARLAEVLSFNSAYAGYLGSVAALVLAASVLSVVTFLFLMELVENMLAAFAAWFVVFFTNPMLPYSSQLYPEGLAAPVIMVALWLSWRGPRGWFSPAVAAIAVAVLPWIHFRYAPIVVILFVYLFLQVRRFHPPAVSLVFGINALSAVALALYSLVSYGSISPTAAYSSWGSPLSLGVLPTGLPGLLLDQSHGLFVYAPIYAIVLASWLVLLLTKFSWKQYLLPISALLFLAEAVVSAMHPLWAGGWSIPPRFLVPVVPLAAIPFAASLEAALGRAIIIRKWRTLYLGAVGILGAATFVVAACTTAAPDLYFNIITGKVLVAASRGLGQVTGVRVLLNDYWPMMVSDSPLVYRPTQTWGDIKLGSIEKDGSSPLQYSLILDPSRDSAGPLTPETYMSLRSGKYVGRVYLKIDSAQGDDVVARIYSEIYVEGKPQVVASREVKRADFGQTNSYQAFELEFPYSGLDPVRLQAYYTGKAKMWFGGMVMERR